MENLLEKIEDVLIAEVEVHTSMISSSHQFNEAIKSGEHESINKQRIVNDDAVCTLEKLEEKRTDYCSEAAGRLGIFRKPLKLSMLLEKIPAEWKKRLEHQQQVLKLKIAELTSINTSNRILLEEGLKVIGATFTCIKKTESRFAGYGNRGQTMPSSLISIINRTV